MVSTHRYVEWNGIFHFAGPISFHSRLITRLILDKMLKDHGIVAVLSALAGKPVFKILPLPDRLKHHFRVMRATCELFSWESMPGKYANRAN